MTKGKEVAIVEQTAYPMLVEDDTLELLADTLGSGVTPWDMTRLKMPNSGAVDWMFDDGDGTKAYSEIEVVIAGANLTGRQFWRQSMDEGGGGLPPDCSSVDGAVGRGVNTLDVSPPGAHECSACPWSQFGSAEKGNGPRCQNRAAIIFFPRGSLLPAFMSVPPTSLKNLRSYMYRLAGKRRKWYHVATKLKLESTKNVAGINYSKLVAEFAGEISDVDKERMNVVHQQLNDYLNTQLVGGGNGAGGPLESGAQAPD